MIFKKKYLKNHVKSLRNVLSAVNEYPKNKHPKSHVKTWLYNMFWNLKKKCYLS